MNTFGKNKAGAVTLMRAAALPGPGIRAMVRRAAAEEAVYSGATISVCEGQRP